MTDLSHEEIGALVNKAKELTKSINNRFICQTLICAAADLLIEKVTCKHLDCLQKNVDTLHKLLDAHTAVAAYEKGFTGNKPPDPFEELKALLGLHGVNVVNIEE